jgi:2-polyprenyl-3-methyl-5-hydroxy-6-metoxy-1,4-benzoquinol methylase
MSSSLPCNIPVVLEYVAKNIFSKVDPAKLDLSMLTEGKPLPAPDFKILDVGCGFGKWGFLIRDSFDVMIFQNFNKEDWKIDITAIEPFPKCITPIQEQIYNRIIKEDLFDCIDDLGKFDLVIFGDVIEHFEKEKGYEVLEKLFEHADNIIVSTPNGFLPQGAWAENEKEIHKSGWVLEDFERYNVVEHKVIEDTFFKDIIASIPNAPEELKKPISLLVLWIRKKQ